MSDWGFETRQVHAGAEPDATGARVTPIYQTSSFVFRDTEHAAALFGLAELGNIYTRIMNPTQDAFEQRMTALEGGVGALAVASGQAAQTVALLNLAENGGHIVSSTSLYGGTYNQLHYTFPKMGIEVDVRRPRRPRRLEGRDPSEHEGVLRREHRQPEGRHLRLRGRLRRSRTTTASRSSSTTRSRARTSSSRCAHGANIVVHSATKFIGGHGTSIGGVIVDGGSFDYVASGRFPGFTEPDPSYHGVMFSQLPDALRPARVHPQGAPPVPARHRPRDLAVQRVPVPPGSADAEPPHGAPLAERARRSRSGSRRAARWSGSRTPGLQSSKWYDRAQKYAPRGQGAIIAFELQGRRRGRPQLHRQPRAVQPPRERR